MMRHLISIMAIAGLNSCGSHSTRRESVAQSKDRFCKLSIVVGSSVRPELVPPGPGAGKWNSEPKTMDNIILAKMAPGYLQQPSTIQQYGEEAAGTFNHYFDNNGLDYKVNPAKLIHDVPRIKSLFDDCQQLVTETARGLQDGHYPFTTAKAPVDVVKREESKNWYLAVNGFSYYVTGEIDVSSSGEVKISGLWHLWDFYDWDPGVKVPIDTPMGTIKVDQDRIGQLHRQGLAKEFATVGSVVF
jgi:hypothetical protein